jgi:hypothetical protein
VSHKLRARKAPSAAPPPTVPGAMKARNTGAGMGSFIQLLTEHIGKVRAQLPPVITRRPSRRHPARRLRSHRRSTSPRSRAPALPPSFSTASVIVFCKFLDVAVQTDHCELRFTNDASPVSVYVRAGIAFAVRISSIVLMAREAGPVWGFPFLAQHFISTGSVQVCFVWCIFRRFLQPD